MDYASAARAANRGDAWKETGYREYTRDDGSYRLKYDFYLDSLKNNAHEVASQVKVPTVIVHGDADDIVPHNQSLVASDLIPNCTLHTIHDCDHFFSDPDHKEKMWRIIVSFIAEQML